MVPEPASHTLQPKYTSKSRCKAKISSPRKIFHTRKSSSSIVVEREPGWKREAGRSWEPPRPEFWVIEGWQTPGGPRLHKGTGPSTPEQNPVPPPGQTIPLATQGQG